MISNSLQTMDVQSVLHPYTELNRHEQAGPMVLVKGEGCRVFDETGKDYIEGMAGLWSASLGFSETRIADAIGRQLRELPFYHLFNGKAHVPAIRLADRLRQMAPAPMARVFFGNSGSDANDTAIKIVWYYNNAVGRPQKKKIIARRQGYHGVSIATASLTGLPANQKLFDLPISNILHTACPHHYRFAGTGETEEAFSARLAADLERQILEEGPDTVAAFIAEPVMGAGGVIVPPRGYFEAIQAVLARYDVMLIADEVICGFGRTGNMWGSQTFGMRPDIVTCAKALSGSYLPISATMVSEAVYDGLCAGSKEVGVFGHGYTYTGHPVAAAAALSALEIYEEIDVVEVVSRASRRFLEKLHGFANHPLVGETRGVGLVGAIELSADKSARKSFDPASGIGPAVVAEAQRHGVILRSMVNDTISFCPPLIISDNEIDLMFDRFEAALDVVIAEKHLQH